MPQTPATRWCPTAEQLMILEEMYRSGVRTPNAAEIQQITAHLAFYGRIEGKNVFYWFQNHKARERQRLRRRLCARHQATAAAQQQSAAAAPPNAASAAAAAGAAHPAMLHPVHSGSPPYCLIPQGHFHDAAASHQELDLAGNKIGECGPYDQEWAELMDGGGCTGGTSDGGIPTCFRPLKTLELFPTKSTGLRDECSSSKSSSCSTSTS